MKNLPENKIVLITGGSSGIGKQLAIELSAFRTRLILVSRNISRLEETSKLICEKYPDLETPVIMSCDVTKENEVQNTVSAIIKQFGRIDILINNAGSGLYGPAINCSIADFREVIHVNFLGAVHFTLEVLPHMLKNGKGQIIFISSVAGLYGLPNYSAYSASKAALKAFSQSIRTENANLGISVLHVSPDYTKTGFFQNEKWVMGATPKRGKFASVEKVAKTIVHQIIQNKKETILSSRGKMLQLVSILFPGFTRSYFIYRNNKNPKNRKSHETKTVDHRSFPESG